MRIVLFIKFIVLLKFDGWVISWNIGKHFHAYICHIALKRQTGGQICLLSDKCFIDFFIMFKKMLFEFVVSLLKATKQELEQNCPLVEALCAHTDIYRSTYNFKKNIWICWPAFEISWKVEQILISYLPHFTILKVTSRTDTYKG